MKNAKDRTEKMWSKNNWRERRGRQGKIFKLRPLQNTTEIVAFQNKFAAHFTMFDIHRNYWIPNLISLLDEKSISYLTDLPKEDKIDF